MDDDDPQTTPPPAKRSTDEISEGEPSKSSTPPTPDSLNEAGGAEGLSPEQKERMALKKFEAETKRIAVAVGTEKLGPSWIKALLSEFKKPYIKEVDAIKRACYYKLCFAGQLSSERVIGSGSLINNFGYQKLSVCIVTVKGVKSLDMADLQSTVSRCSIY